MTTTNTLPPCGAGLAPCAELSAGSTEGSAERASHIFGSAVADALFGLFLFVTITCLGFLVLLRVAVS